MSTEYSTSVLDRANRHLVIEEAEEGNGHIGVVAYFISKEPGSGDEKTNWAKAEEIVLGEYAKRTARKDKLVRHQLA